MAWIAKPIWIGVIMKYKQPKILMIQEESCRWRLETEKGTVLQDNIMLGLRAEAEDYVKRYVSTYPLWTYELIIKEKK